ncbi:membrane protein [Pandoraea communis]|uniref:Membrane protein n=2 Tax=Burkholderiaceae TaxID=119060 RepID=A0A5E4U031_9BURK|nr:membrane protein [Pandoraea communis]
MRRLIGGLPMVAPVAVLLRHYVTRHNTQVRMPPGRPARTGLPKAALHGSESKMTKFQRRAHRERHRTEHIGWLRAAVLGANDGIISTASLVAGVAAAHASHASIVTTAVAGLVAGAMSMAAGEFVSVYSQADTEKADLTREREELKNSPDAEHRELTAIYVRRGLDQQLADQVATQLMAHDALGAHARDELGISETLSARPLQAALASAGSFAVGAAMPLAVVLLAPEQSLLYWIVATSILFLALLGVAAAAVGGTPLFKSALRVAFWGTFAMAVTAGVGAVFGTTV